MKGDQQPSRQSRRNLVLSPIDFVRVFPNGPSIQDTNTSYHDTTTTIPNTISRNSGPPTVIRMPHVSLDSSSEYSSRRINKHLDAQSLPHHDQQNHNQMIRQTFSAPNPQMFRPPLSNNAKPAPVQSYHVPDEVMYSVSSRASPSKISSSSSSMQHETFHYIQKQINDMHIPKLRLMLIFEHLS